MNFTNIARGKRKDNPNEWVYGYYYCVFDCEEPAHKAFTDRGLSFPECDEFHHYILPLGGACANDKTIEELRVEIIPETYGICSMIPDITGERMMFTGDIVKVSDTGGENILCVVAFGNCGGIQNTNRPVGYMGFYLEPGNEISKNMMEYGMRNDPVFFLNERRLEIVGNIHDDQRLLKT